MPIVSKQYTVHIGEPALREIVDKFGTEVLTPLYEACVEEFEKTFYEAYDHEPSEEMVYVEYDEGYDGPMVISEAGGCFWCTHKEYDRTFKRIVHILHGPVEFAVEEDGFEVWE